ncbi:transporter substrate-binding domain-containing protein [Temperatibacter marinus]|uniref:Transporter substrate-binding domain-containing protein n=1 Tax=Temperatibacter marinus TaxID=1456591 RepID=A0AA52EHS0_9PROT|nr:transporter substrate-binding domain-containing protein [Temperatibacter marinus]WND03025.1 transporter substrate-binding domain-containing protein [Temperatibacter marinus]
MRLYLVTIMLFIICPSAANADETCKTINAYSANWRGISEFGDSMPLQGVAIDAVKKLLTHQDLPYTIKPRKNWPRLLAALKRGEIDMIGGIYKTTDRLKDISFIGPIHRVPVHIYTTKGNAEFIKTKEDLTGKVTIMSTHSSFGEEIEAYLAEKTTVLKISSYDFHITKMLARGRIDFFVGTQLNSLNDIKVAGLEGKIIELEEPIGFNDVYLGLSKKSPCYDHIVNISIYPVVE